MIARTVASGSPWIPAFYPGTGDIFSSVLLGALLQGDSLPLSVERAVRLISRGIHISMEAQTVPTEGILLERVLPMLADRQDRHMYEEF